MTFEDAMGKDLRALIDQSGAPLTTVTRLTTLPSDHLKRGAFRLGFADGRVLKGRRLGTPREAARLHRLAAHLDRRFFPSVLARRGSALLIEWRHGTPVEQRKLEGQSLHLCGEVLGRLHATPVDDRLRAAYAFPVTQWWGRLAKNVATLVDLSALTAAEASDALHLARQRRPETGHSCIAHGDFCLENLVRDPDGGLAVVDSENLTLESAGYDLARTWHRWPMTDAEARAFLSGYHLHNDPSSFTLHADFWAVAVLSEAAVFRIAGATPGAMEPVTKLRALLQGDLRPWNPGHADGGPCP